MAHRSIMLSAPKRPILSHSNHEIVQQFDMDCNMLKLWFINTEKLFMGTVGSESCEVITFY